MAVQIRIMGKNVLLLGEMNYEKDGFPAGYVNILLPRFFIAEDNSDFNLFGEKQLTWGFSATTAISFTKHCDESFWAFILTFFGFGISISKQTSW